MQEKQPSFIRLLRNTAERTTCSPFGANARLLPVFPTEDPDITIIMKKIFNMALLLLCSVCAFTACEDDNDSNPTLVQPTEFVLNTPAYTGSEIDLAHSESVNLTWSQPVYTTDNAPVVATYEFQVSPTGNFTVSAAEAEADESGQTVADYMTLDETTTLCKAAVSAEAIDKALVQLLKWEEGNVPAVQEAFIRVRATVAGRNEVVSNAVKLTFVPYYIELKDAPVEMWYLIGSCIGDGKWTNSAEAVGTSLIPMNTVPGYEYDKKTGQGILSFTGYFTTDGFKLIKTLGGWDDQWGSSDGGTTGVKNDGGSGNICVPENGYYTVQLDTKNDKLTVTKADVTPTVYARMFIAGDFNGWAETTEMTAVNTAECMAGHNHVWTCVVEAPEGTTAKFLQPGWQPNWGSDTFPAGTGVSNGANIPVGAGTWVVTFNDVDGSYVFTAK